MICLDIKAKNRYDNYLNKLLDGINLSSYVWVINFEDFLYSENSKLEEDFFKEDVLNADEFTKCISRESYYMIFTDIKAYPLGYERMEIKTFKDFLKSSCEVAILCTDVIATEFYCKNEDILDKVYNNCLSNNCFQNVECRSIEDVLERSLIVW